MTGRVGDHTARAGVVARRSRRTFGAVVGFIALLAACCPPATTQVSDQGVLSTVAVEAGRGYGFALRAQVNDAPGSGDDGSSDTGVPPTSGQAERDAASSHDLDAGPDLSARFESAWRLVDERYWDLDSLDVDWDEVGERYRDRLAETADEAELYSLLEEMYDELGDNHSVYVPPARVAEIREAYGDLPCVAVFDSSAALPVTKHRSSQVVGVTQALRAQVPEGLATEQLGPIEYGVASVNDHSVGYIRLADLASDGTASGLRSAVQRLAAAGVDALVLDLRGNPGGRLVTMMQAAGVFTRGFLWRAVMSWTLPLPYPAIGDPITQAPLVVLIDASVNSAAEGLAGALQTNGRAYLVGETTAGNVEAVLPFCLRDGSQAWIATGVLAPLLGATWEGRGVVPDLAVPGEDAYEAALEYLSTTFDQARESGAAGHGSNGAGEPSTGG